MTYKVTARKWRPQTFSEVVYQEHISKTLQNSIQSGRISHAYLFAGPRGVGKTTMARILAKALNCKEGPTPHPCGVCDNCVEIRRGNSFDVIEIDGASNNGVDDIRDLREKVNFAPVKSKYKVYIIDEVHMVTTPAFNALLKTLEEPPPHVVFVFATTEIHKIPDTILSRCQKFFFKTIPAENIVEHLRNIVAKEGFRVSDKALYPIARAAQGSMRDAQSLLDQVISFSDVAGDGQSVEKEIGRDGTLSLLGIVPIESYCALLGYIADGDVAAVITEAERVADMGADIPRFVDGFSEILRALRLVRHKIPVKDLLGLSGSEVTLLEALAPRFSDEEISMNFRVLDELHRNLRFSNNERVNLEMALLDMLGVKRMPSLSAVLKKLEETGDSGRGNPAASGTRRVPGTGGKTASVPEKRLDIREAWSRLLEYVRDEKQYLNFVLKPSEAAFDGDTVLISYPGGVDHAYYGRILDSKNLAFLEGKMAEFTGKAVKVRVGFGDAPAGDARTGAVTAGPAANNPEDDGAIPPPESQMMKNPEIIEYESKNPTVEKIKNIFQGQIIKKGEGDA